MAGPTQDTSSHSPHPPTATPLHWVASWYFDGHEPPVPNEDAHVGSGTRPEDTDPCHGEGGRIHRGLRSLGRGMPRAGVRLWGGRDGAEQCDAGGRTSGGAASPRASPSLGLQGPLSSTHAHRRRPHTEHRGAASDGPLTARSFTRYHVPAPVAPRRCGLLQGTGPQPPAFPPPKSFFCQ